MSYDQIALHHGDILITSKLGDGYSGDLLYLVKQHKPFDSWYGIVVLGYGSCSLCDTMEAIMEMPLEQSLEAMQNLRRSTVPTWYNKTGIIYYLKHSADSQWWYHMHGGPEFVAECLNILESN